MKKEAVEKPGQKLHPDETPDDEKKRQDKAGSIGFPPVVARSKTRAPTRGARVFDDGVGDGQSDNNLKGRAKTPTVVNRALTI